MSSAAAALLKHKQATGTTNTGPKTAPKAADPATTKSIIEAMFKKDNATCADSPEVRTGQLRGFHGVHQREHRQHEAMFCRAGHVAVRSYVYS